MKLLIASETINKLPCDDIERLVRGLATILHEDYGVKKLNVEISMGYVRAVNDDDETFDIETRRIIEESIRQGLNGLVANLYRDGETVQ